MISYLRLLRNGAAAAGARPALEEGLESELLVPHPRRRHRGRRMTVGAYQVLALVGLRHGEAGGEVGGPVASAGGEVAGVVEVGGGHRGQVAGAAA